MQGAPSPLALIGLGAVGSRLASAWQEHGLSVVGYSPSGGSRQRARDSGIAVVDELAQALEGARCVVWCVGDGALAAAVSEASRALPQGARPICLHTCGSRGPSVLAPLAAQGCPAGTLHPLAAFAAEGPGPHLAGAWCAISGDASALSAASALAQLLGARAFVLAGTDAAALEYHAAATLLSNGTVALASLALEHAERACLVPGAARPAFQALLESTLANLAREEPARALTGPVARGDVETVRAHLRALAADASALAAYRAVSRRLLELARQQGRIGADAARAIELLLSQ